MSALLDPPRTLPVQNLSVSSIGLFLKCPTRWKRRYLDGEWEPTSGAAVIGSAVGAAEALNYQQKIVTETDLAEQDVLDAYADEFDLKADTEEIDWQGEKPGTLKDAGARVLPVYHRIVAPTVHPASVEREFRLDFEGVEWGVRGYFDVEETDDGIVDMKVKAKALSQQDADTAFQPSMYMLAKRAEGSPAPEFRYHPMVKVRSPELKHVHPVVTTRTDLQLDNFTNRIYSVAAEIAWRTEHDIWDGAAEGVWWCSQKWCGFHATCPYGGQR